MDTSELITIDPDILGGVPVFKGTRVPIKTLFQYLENDYSLDEFLECFPSVTRDAARQVWECSEQALLPSAGIRIFENAEGRSLIPAQGWHNPGN